MTPNTRFGRVSLASGMLGVVFAVTARYTESIYDSNTWFVTEFIERHGLWRPGEGIPEAKATTVFTLTELNAIGWCYAVSIVCSLVAILSSFEAERRGEKPLLHAAGLVVGGMGLVTINLAWGLPALIASALAIIVMRHVQKEP